MTKNTKYISVAILTVLVIGFGSFYAGRKSSTDTTNELQNSTTTKTTTVVATSSKPSTTKTPIKSTTLISGNTTGFNSYSSAEYGFVIKYPSYVQMSSVFPTFHELSNNWRVYSSPANQGKAVASFSIHKIDQGTISTKDTSYPLYFSAEVRVGVSPNVKECYSIDPGFTNQKVTNVTINGVAFKKFETNDAATMKYVQVESYRTIHNNMCYVIEQIKNGSSYRDEKMSPGIAETTLTNYYNTGGTIVKTFKFTK